MVALFYQSSVALITLSNLGELTALVLRDSLQEASLAPTETGRGFLLSESPTVLL